MFSKIKILFIPCKCNNYLPEFLLPKRMLFYAISAFLLKIIVVISILSFPIEALLTPDIKILEADKIIKLTNDIRLKKGLEPLKENFLLNSSALAKAQDILINQYFAHTSPQGKKFSDWFNNFKYDYRFAGENLAMGFSGGEAVVNAWFRSPTHYSNMVDSDYEEVGVGIAEGEYKGKPTVIFVQHFGKKKKENKGIELITTKKEFSVIDLSCTKILISQAFGQDSSSIRARTCFHSEIAQADIDFSNYRLILYPSQKDNNVWLGSAVISEEQKKEILNNVVMASLEVMDLSGQKIIKDIEWSNIVPEEPSLISQYLFIKSYPSDYTKPLLDLSMWYLSLLTFLLSITLILAIFINIKKQYPLIISTAIILIVFLGILIAF